MKMENIEEKRFRRTEMHKLEGTIDKRHTFLVYTFARASLLILVIVSILLMTGIADAAITYNPLYDRIEITNQTASMSDINQSINDPSILEEVSLKIWLLKKKITFSSDAGLYINDSDCDELRLLSMNDGNDVNIQGYGILEISNTIITSWNTTTNAPAEEYPDRAYIYLKGNIGSATLFNSIFTNLGTSSRAGVELNYDPNKTAHIENCTFIDTILTQSGAKEVYIVGNLIDKRTVGDIFVLKDQDNSIVSDNTLNSMIHVSVADNVTTQNNMITWNGHNGFCFDGSQNSIAMNDTVTGCDHNGMQMSSNNADNYIPAFNCIFKNCDVHSADMGDYSTRVNDNAYYITWNGYDDSSKIRDSLIEDCVAYDIMSRGIAFDGAVNFTVRRFKTWNTNGEDIDFLHSSNCYAIDSDLDDQIRASSSDNIKVINTKFAKINWVEEADITVYYYLNVLVQNENGNPINNAKITISPLNTAVDYYNITVNDTITNLHTYTISTPLMEGKLLSPQLKTETYTGADGHTPLPSDNDNTLVIAEHRQDRHGSPWSAYPKITTYFNYTITAEKDGVSATATEIDPDETWYREDPNSYPGEGKGTVVITLPISAETGTISGTVTNITNGAPIEGAMVEAGAGYDNTDQNGKYTISNIPAGNYMVTASATGYESLSQDNVVVSEGATTTVDFVLEDNISPYTSDHSPAKDTTSVSRDTNIVVHIKDDGLGVDQSSIVMTVEGSIVSPTITGDANDYALTYDPPSDFDYDQIVDITIDAQDLASPANVVSRDSYSFAIESASTGDLVGYWKFDNGSGTTAVDSSGNGNDGTLTNGPIWVDGKIGKALSFDGTDDYVIISDSDNLDGFSAFSISTWVYAYTIGEECYGRIIVKGDGDPYGLMIESDTKISFYINGDRLESNENFSLNSWHHIGVTYEKDVINGRKIYIDGVLSKSQTNTFTVNSGANDLYIGNRSTLDRTFDGIIDEVRIYNRALSADEVLALYQEGLSKFSINLDLEAKPVKGNRGAKVYIYGPKPATALVWSDTNLSTDSNDDLELDLSGFTGDRNQNYDIKIEMSNYLHKKVLNHNLVDNITTAQTLKIGNLNDSDQEINSSDWGVMLSKWGTADPDADFNEDGLVNTIDFSFMNRNWLATGD